MCEHLRNFTLKEIQKNWELVSGWLLGKVHLKNRNDLIIFTR